MREKTKDQSASERLAGSFDPDLCVMVFFDFFL